MDLLCHGCGSKHGQTSSRSPVYESTEHTSFFQGKIGKYDTLKHQLISEPLLNIIT